MMLFHLSVLVGYCACLGINTHINSWNFTSTLTSSLTLTTSNSSQDACGKMVTSQRGLYHLQNYSSNSTLEHWDFTTSTATSRFDFPNPAFDYAADYDSTRMVF